MFGKSAGFNLVFIGEFQGHHTRDTRDRHLFGQDGGYILAGTTNSFGAGYTDFWVLKLNSSGNVSWQKTYGVNDNDSAYSIQQTSDGGYIVAGITKAFAAYSTDILVLKLDSSGNFSWQNRYKVYGLYHDSYISSIQQTPGGDYIVAGWFTDKTFYYGSDIWVLKLDSSGGIYWDMTYGGVYWDVLRSIQQTSDGGYILAESIRSSDSVEGDIRVLKLDGSRDLSWLKKYGGSSNDEASSIQQTLDGGYILAGTTDSFGAGGGDIWVLKLDSSGNVSWQKTYGGSGYDEASSIQQTLDGGYIVAGTTDSFGAGGGDIWVLKLDNNGEIPGCDLINISQAIIQGEYFYAIYENISYQIYTATSGSTKVSPHNSSAKISNPCEISYCSTWTEVISKYNSYVGGSASWNNVITCYNQYASP